MSFSSLGSNLSRKGYKLVGIDVRNVNCPANFQAQPIMDIPYECELISLEFSSNQSFGGLDIAGYDEAGNLQQIFLAEASGTVAGNLSVGFIDTETSNIMAVGVYDTTNGKYKANLTRSLYFPNGVKITCLSTSATTACVVTTEGAIAQYEG